MQEKPIVVCAVDLFDPRKKVCAFTQRYAASIGADIVVLVVIPKQDVYKAGITGLIEQPNTLAAAADALNQYVKDMFPDCSVRQEIRQGVIADTIVAYAKEQQARAIIMGTHGRKHLNKMIFGSVASRVVADAGAIPVVTIGTSD